jgi:hypothetical protein
LATLEVNFHSTFPGVVAPSVEISTVGVSYVVTSGQGIKTVYRVDTTGKQTQVADISVAQGIIPTGGTAFIATTNSFVVIVQSGLRSSLVFVDLVSGTIEQIVILQSWSPASIRNSLEFGLISYVALADGTPAVAQVDKSGSQSLLFQASSPVSGAHVDTVAAFNATSKSLVASLIYASSGLSVLWFVDFQAQTGVLLPMQAYSSGLA